MGCKMLHAQQPDPPNASHQKTAGTGMPIKKLNNMQSFMLSGRQLSTITSHSSPEYRVWNIMTRNKYMGKSHLWQRNLPKTSIIAHDYSSFTIFCNFHECLRALLEKGCFLDVLSIPLSCMITGATAATSLHYYYLQCKLMELDSHKKLLKCQMTIFLTIKTIWMYLTKLPNIDIAINLSKRMSARIWER